MRHLILICFLIFISCTKQEVKVVVNKQENSMLSIVKVHAEPQGVLPDYQTEIAEWNEMTVLKNFLVRFKKASPKEILSNSIELKGLIKSLIESPKPEILNNPSFETRVNILYNESLRLADMNTIPAITATEVNTQADKIINAFSAVNAKINTTFSKKKFEDEITIDVKWIGLDSTKIDTISKNSILKKMDEKLSKQTN